MLTLVRLSEDYRDQLDDMMAEWTASGERIIPWSIRKNDYRNFEKYLRELDVMEPRDGLVPDVTYFALDTERNIFVGAVNIRLRLSERLLFDGGHIGDGIRPSERGRGYGTELVRLALAECKRRGIRRVLMVCDRDNRASARTIEKNGGVLWNEVMTEDGPVLRYWIGAADQGGLCSVRNDGIRLISLNERPDLLESASAWFHAKWGIPEEAYRESMEASLSGKSPVPRWFLALHGERIAGGLGVIGNDFHPRRDLTPNICAVYVDEAYRGRRIAGDLLGLACRSMAADGIFTLYLLTDRTGFYERYGWDYLCPVTQAGESEPSRMYVHRTARENE